MSVTDEMVLAAAVEFGKVAIYGGLGLLLLGCFISVAGNEDDGGTVGGTGCGVFVLGVAIVLLGILERL